MTKNDVWPTPDRFLTMMKNPKLAFGPSHLRNVEMVQTNLGVKVASGGVASVVKAVDAKSSDLALRVFLCTDEARETRFKALRDLFPHKEMGSNDIRNDRYPEIVRFRYHEAGVRAELNGPLYPLLEMEWQGEYNLHGWCSYCVDNGIQDRLLDTAAGVRRFVRKLREDGLVHGDLHHENVLVDSAGKIFVIDYDQFGAVDDSSVKREGGREVYQPIRRQDTERTQAWDNFSTIVIYLALIATAEDPQIWEEFVHAEDNENMLFTVRDYETPGKSGIFQRLSESQDPVVRVFADAVRRNCNQPRRSSPTIEELLALADEQKRLKQALTNGDNEDIFTLGEKAAHQSMIDAMGHRQRVKAAFRLADEVAAILDLADEISDGNDLAADEFAKVYDARKLRQFPEMIGERVEPLAYAVQNFIAPIILGNADSGEYNVVVDKAGAVHLRWTWPDERFSAECLVAASPSRPKKGEFPYQLELTHKKTTRPTGKLTVELAHRLMRTSYENVVARGYRCPAMSDRRFREWYVSVWFLIDIGVDLLPTDPIVLGQIA